MKNSHDRYSDYLQTDYWKAVTDAVKKRDGYRCRLCNSQHDLCAHHRDYSHRGKELEFLDDLTTLCRRCHEIFHGHAPDVKQKEKAVKRLPGQPREYKATSRIDLVAVERDMPEGNGDIVLTNALIQKCRNNYGGFTNAAIIPLGVSFPLIAGWSKRLQGKTITRALYRTALEGRYIYNAKPNETETPPAVKP